MLTTPTLANYKLATSIVSMESKDVHSSCFDVRCCFLMIVLIIFLFGSLWTSPSPTTVPSDPLTPKSSSHASASSNSLIDRFNTTFTVYYSSILISNPSTSISVHNNIHLPTEYHNTTNNTNLNLIPSQHDHNSTKTARFNSKNISSRNSTILNNSCCINPQSIAFTIDINTFVDNTDNNNPESMTTSVANYIIFHRMAKTGSMTFQTIIRSLGAKNWDTGHVTIIQGLTSSRIHQIEEIGAYTAISKNNMKSYHYQKLQNKCYYLLNPDAESNTNSKLQKKNKNKNKSKNKNKRNTKNKDISKNRNKTDRIPKYCLFVTHLPFIDNMTYIERALNYSQYTPNFQVTFGIGVGVGIGSGSNNAINYNYNYNYVNRQLDGKFQFITMIRHPIDRIISFFYYLRGMGGGGSLHSSNPAKNGIIRLTKQYTLKQCIQDLNQSEYQMEQTKISKYGKRVGQVIKQTEMLPRKDVCRLSVNYMTQYYCGQDSVLCFPRHLTVASLQRAIFNLNTYFTFVGILDEFDLSMKVFYKQFGYLFDKKKIRDIEEFETKMKGAVNKYMNSKMGYVSNKTDFRPELCKDHPLYQYLQSKNLLDLELYQYAKKRFYITVKQLGLGND